MVRHEIGLVVYTLHAKWPPILQVVRKDKGRLNPHASRCCVHHSRAEDSYGSSLILQYSVASAVSPPLSYTNSSHAGGPPPTFIMSTSWSCSFVCLSTNQAFPPAWLAVPPPELKAPSSPCLPQKSEHQTLKSPLQDLTTCPPEFPPPDSQLLVTLPLPSLVMAESHVQRFLIV